MAWTEQHLSIGNRNAVYLEAAPSRASNVILLLHAFPIGMRLWEDVSIPYGWRAIAPALPGFDGTALPPVDSTAIDDYARSAIELMDELHVRAFVVGGVSMGGYAALGVWRLASERCRGLVLADSRANADSEQGRVGREAMLTRVRERGPSAIADDMVPKLLGDTTRASRPGVVSRVRALIESQTTDAIAAAIVRMRDRPDSTPLLGRITVPSLIVVGAEDTLTPPPESETMRDALPNATMDTLPGAGHLACIEDPAAFSAALARFLAAFN